MKWQFDDKTTNGQFIALMQEKELKGEGLLNGKQEMINTLVFNTGEKQAVTIDGISYTMPAQSIVPLVANQHFSFTNAAELIAWQFNRNFYCIAEHDAEVGCVGFLFYGIQHPLFIPLTPEEVESVTMIQTLCIEDMKVADKMQGEMLRTLLKRLIIRVTRIAKNQCKNTTVITDDKLDILRHFNLLLEGNYRVQHEVQFYAQALNKAAKTLSNMFSLCNYPAPSKLIQGRIIMEAKRYLLYTDKSAKEVAEALGFISTAHFSKFFKNGTGTNFSKYREQSGRQHLEMESTGSG